MQVIGAGRIGTALARRARERGLSLSLLDRVSSWAVLDGAAGEPILLAVRNDDLDAVIARVPQHRHCDLVFVQNGAIRELLAAHGLSDATRGLLYTLVARKGDEGQAGAPSIFVGPHGREVVQLFLSLGLPTEHVERNTFAVYELEKLLWLAILGPLCEKTGETVGAVADTRAAEIALLVLELTPVGRAAWGVEAEPAVLSQRIVAYAKAIASYRASVKEWPWRNGWLQATARAHALPTPRHDALLREVGQPK